MYGCRDTARGRAGQLTVDAGHCSMGWSCVRCIHSCVAMGLGGAVRGACVAAGLWGRAEL